MDLRCHRRFISQNKVFNMIVFFRKITWAPLQNRRQVQDMSPRKPLLPRSRSRPPSLNFSPCGGAAITESPPFQQPLVQLQVRHELEQPQPHRQTQMCMPPPAATTHEGTSRHRANSCPSHERRPSEARTPHSPFNHKVACNVSASRFGVAARCHSQTQNLPCRSSSYIEKAL